MIGESRWLPVAVGGLAVVLGAALTLKPFSSLDALTIYIAASLCVAGAGEVLSARGEVKPWPARVTGGLLVLAGILAVALPGLTVRAVALVAGVAMVVSGLTRLFSGCAAGSRSGSRRWSAGWPA